MRLKDGDWQGQGKGTQLSGAGANTKIGRHGFTRWLHLHQNKALYVAACGDTNVSLGAWKYQGNIQINMELYRRSPV